MTSHQGQSIKDRRGTHGPPVPQIWCNSDYYLQSRTIPVFKHTLAPSEKWPTQEISVRFGPFFIELSCSHRKMQSLCQGKGQRSHKAKNRRKHFRGEIGRAISNLVAVLVSDLWAMAGKNGTVFFNNWPPS